VGNSAALCRLTGDACAGNGLEVAPDSARVLPQDSTPADLRDALSAALADETADAVVGVFISPLREADSAVTEALAAASADSPKPLVSTVLSFAGAADHGRPPTAVPAFPSPEIAVAALVRTVGYAEWRRQPEGTVPTFDDIDDRAARGVLADVLRQSPDGGRLAGEPLRQLLAAYGVSVWPALPAGSPDQARSAAPSWVIRWR